MKKISATRFISPTFLTLWLLTKTLSKICILLTKTKGSPLNWETTVWVSIKNDTRIKPHLNRMAPWSVPARKLGSGSKGRCDGLREVIRIRGVSSGAGRRRGVRGAHAPRLLRERIRLSGVSGGAGRRSGAGGANALRLLVLAAGIRCTWHVCTGLSFTLLTQIINFFNQIKKILRYRYYKNQYANYKYCTKQPSLHIF